MIHHAGIGMKSLRGAEVLDCTSVLLREDALAKSAIVQPHHGVIFHGAIRVCLRDLIFHPLPIWHASLFPEIAVVMRFSNSAINILPIFVREVTHSPRSVLQRMLAHGIAMRKNRIGGMRE